MRAIAIQFVIVLAEDLESLLHSEGQYNESFCTQFIVIVLAGDLQSVFNSRVSVVVKCMSVRRELIVLSDLITSSVALT